MVGVCACDVLGVEGVVAGRKVVWEDEVATPATRATELWAVGVPVAQSPPVK